MTRTNRRNRSVPRVEGLEGRALLAAGLANGLANGLLAASGEIALKGLHAEIHMASSGVFVVRGSVRVTEVEPGVYRFSDRQAMPGEMNAPPDKSLMTPLDKLGLDRARSVATTVNLGKAELILGGPGSDYLVTRPRAETIVRVDDGSTTTTYDFIGDQVYVEKHADPAPKFSKLP